MPNRSIIIHFHFFKNAGTSVETILRKQFRKRFKTCEPGGATETHPAAALLPVLEEHESLQAISSHTIRFPLPERPAWNLFPLVFIRHPLDRILSMYYFERQQRSRSPGALLAKRYGAAGYIEARLESPRERSLRNYQAWMLGQFNARMGDDESLFNAASTVISELPVAGVVDQFSRSIYHMSEWLTPYFPGLKMKAVHKHRTGPARMSLDERIDHLREIVGVDIFKRLSNENALDLELYHRAREKLIASRGEIGHR